MHSSSGSDSDIAVQMNIVTFAFVLYIKMFVLSAAHWYTTLQQQQQQSARRYLYACVYVQFIKY